MFSPFQVFPLENPYLLPPPTASIRILSHLPTHSHLPSMALPYIRSLKTLKPKGLSSQWCATRPSTATYDTNTMGPSMCILWLVVQSPWAPGFLAWWHHCSLHGAANQLLSAPQSLLQFLHERPPCFVRWLAVSIYLCLEDTGRASQKTAILGFHYQALPRIHNSIHIWSLYMWWTPRWISL